MIKKASVEGNFYPKDKLDLGKTLDEVFRKSKLPEEPKGKPFAILVPHAGYIYSGETAAVAFKSLEGYHYEKAIIIAPLHRVSGDFPFFVGDYEAYETPLGLLKTDRDNIVYLLQKPGFGFHNGVDRTEHSLEVQLPFLKYLLPDIAITPILFVHQTLANADTLSDCLSDIMTESTLLVISSDLSHFHDSKTAENMDLKLIDLLVSNKSTVFYDSIIQGHIEACGFGGILTAMSYIKKYRNGEAFNITYTHSGFITRDFDRVVGYLSCAFC